MNRTKSVAFALLLLIVLAPVVAYAQTDTPPVAAIPKPIPVIEPKAMAVLKKSADTMLALRTFRATCYETVTPPAGTDGKPSRPPRYAVATLTAAKPNLMRYDGWYATPSATPINYAAWKKTSATPTYTFVCNGKTHYRQYGNSYRKNNRVGADYLTTILEPWNGFYTTTGSPYSMLTYTQQQGGLLELRLDGTETVGGIVCDVVRYHKTSEYAGDAVDSQGRLFVGRDGIVRRNIDTTGFGGKPGHTRDAVIRGIIANAPVKTPKTTFAYTPPKGVKQEVETPSRPDADPALLTAGIPAPDFMATDADGNSVKLSDLKGKVVVVDFWASWCPPCVESMPHNQKVVAKLQAEGLPVVLLAVDNAEERDAFLGWVKKHPEYNALRFVHAARKTADISGKLYKVSGIPTQYIVDANGVIRSSSVGFGGETDDMEKAIRAALAPKSDK